MRNLIALLLFLACPFAAAQDTDPVADRAVIALGKGEYEAAKKAALELIADEPRDTEKLFAADTLLRCGDAKKSLELFNDYVVARPESEPYLWQRGIAMYFAGKYAEGAKQFEIHREVNPNDVENAAWHFLCVAKNASPAEAQKLLLPAPRDGRPPMAEVLVMLGNGDQELVKNKIASFEKGTGRRGIAEFYGWFYLGLYADAQGDKKAAKKWLEKSAGVAPRNYMGDVARVYAKYLAE